MAYAESYTDAQWQPKTSQCKWESPIEFNYLDFGSFELQTDDKYLQLRGKDLIVATFFWTKYVLYVAVIYQKRDDHTLAGNRYKS